MDSTRLRSQLAQSSHCHSHLPRSILESQLTKKTSQVGAKSRIATSNSDSAGNSNSCGATNRELPVSQRFNQRLHNSCLTIANTVLALMTRGTWSAGRKLTMSHLALQSTWIHSKQSQHRQRVPYGACGAWWCLIESNGCFMFWVMTSTWTELAENAQALHPQTEKMPILESGAITSHYPDFESL